MTKPSNKGPIKTLVPIYENVTDRGPIRWVTRVYLCMAW
jgi:hypothetical protein